MTHYKLALLGFGNVGQAFAQLLLRKRAELEKGYGITWSVSGISTSRHGMAVDPGGIDLEQALQVMQARKNLAGLSVVRDLNDPLEVLRQAKADILFENTPVNYESGQPAINHIHTALEMNMFAITANKGPVVHAFRELTRLAEGRGKKFFFESAVMDGAPIFSLFRGSLPGAQLKSFSGILNSTTNLILGRMEEGESFDEAVKYAQSIGIAETDPSGDVDGWDAAVKVAALATALMDLPLKPQQVRREGIRGITPEMIQSAKQDGKRWKLVCRGSRRGDHAEGSVGPELVGLDSPLYGVTGTSSTVQFETDVLGLLTIIENDPGTNTTAYGLLADFINAVR